MSTEKFLSRFTRSSRDADPHEAHDVDASGSSQAVVSELQRFRLLDQARRQRVEARQFRQLLAVISVSGTLAFLSGIASDLEDSARNLEAQATGEQCDDGGPAECGSGAPTGRR
jgi:hypothetical protein